MATFKRTTIVNLAALVAFVIIFSSTVFSADIDISKEYTARTNKGNYSVQEIKTISFKDKARNKTIEMRVYFPKTKGIYPVIIFSHGNTHSKDSYPEVGKFFASHGYIWIQPTHSDSLVFWDKKGSKRDWAMKSMWDTDRWTSRPKDVSFVINSLKYISQKNPELKSKIDKDKIVVAGHSFGANTAQLIGGARQKLNNKANLTSFLDKRVKCIVPISPAGRGWVGMVDDSWKEMKLPMLSTTGWDDFGPKGRHFDFRLDSFLLCPKEDKYMLVVKNMGHPFPPAQENFNMETATILTFLDAYLNGKESAKKYLKSNDLVKAYKGAAILSWR